MPATGESGSTQGGDACPATPDFSEVCAECRASLAACYAPPCDFEFDANDCVNTTLTFPQCACAGDTDTDPGPTTSTDTDTDAGTTTGGPCEEAPDFSDVCDECRADLLACYAPPCDFEYDPNACVNTTLGFPQCACVSDGSSSSGGSSTGSGTASSG